MSETIKNCLMCVHCTFYAGEQGYSSLTPGSDSQLHCEKKLMTHVGGGNLFWEAYDKKQIQEALATAETCPEYAPEFPNDD